MDTIPRIMNGKGRWAWARAGLVPFLVMVFLSLSTLQAMGSTMEMSAMDKKDCAVQICCSACVSPVLPESPPLITFHKAVFYDSEPVVVFPDKHSIPPYHPPRKSPLVSS